MSENLKPCPACDGAAAIIPHQYRVKCCVYACAMVGPLEDRFGAKWNALPRRTDAAPGMSDGELIARSIANVGALLARTIRPEAFDEASTIVCEEDGSRIDAELDRRAALRKEAKP